MEIPPGYAEVRRRSFVDDPGEGCGQMARLEWQLEADEFLLLERVVDSIIILRRTASTEHGESTSLFASEFPTVKLEFSEELSEDRRLFPWKVIIETNHPELYRVALPAIQEWLGIGIDLAPQREIHFLRQCQNGRVGVVGGWFADQHQKVYGVTCAHVVSTACSAVLSSCFPAVNLRISPNTLGETSQPDAALLNVGGPCVNQMNPTCFALPRGNPRGLFCAAHATLKACCLNRTPILNLDPSLRAKRCAGKVVCLYSEPVYEGYEWRFPHLEISSNKVTRLFLKFPIFKECSVPGDSGSWVVDSQTGEWLGMLTAGSKDRKTWYIIKSKPLLSYFNKRLKVSKSTSRLIPLAWS